MIQIKRNHYYTMALTGFFGLFILLMLWHTLLQPSPHPLTALILIGVITPLLLPFKGLLNNNLKSLTWMSYISLFYFTHGVAESYIAPAHYFGWLETLFSLLLCTGSGLYVYTAE